MLILNNSKLEVYVRSDRSLFRRAEVDPVAQLADFSLAFFFFFCLICLQKDKPGSHSYHMIVTGFQGWCDSNHKKKKRKAVKKLNLELKWRQEGWHLSFKFYCNVLFNKRGLCQPLARVSHVCETPSNNKIRFNPFITLHSIFISIYCWGLTPKLSGPRYLTSMNILKQADTQTHTLLHWLD